MKTVTSHIIDLEELQSETFNSGDVDKLLEFFIPTLWVFHPQNTSGLAGWRQ